jgi:hypothetical protein
VSSTTIPDMPTVPVESPEDTAAEVYLSAIRAQRWTSYDDYTREVLAREAATWESRAAEWEQEHGPKAA